MIKPCADYDICIEMFISRFGANDTIVFNKNIGFARLQYKNCGPINLLDDAYCMDFF